MHGFWEVLSAVLPVFCLTGIGVLLRQVRWLTSEADQSFIRVVVNVLVPCLILDKVVGNPALRDLRNLIVPPLFGFGGICAGLAVAWVLRRFSGAVTEPEQRTFAAVTGFQNYGYVPQPIIEQLYPGGTLGVLFLHNLGVDTGMWTLGLVALGHAGLSEWRKLINAPILAVFAAVALNFIVVAPWFPAGLLTAFRFVGTTNQLLGACAFPLAIVLIGATMAETVGELRGGAGMRLMFLSVVVRCGILPVLMLTAARFIPCSPELKRVLIVEAAMPAAVFPIVMARHYGGDVLTAVRVVVATSAVGLVSIPIWIQVGIWWLGP
jgi:hypothetical protein